MNIYFDVDGVLKDSASPADDIKALVNYCMLHYPNTIYWLTTHCRGGYNNTRNTLKDVFPNELLDRVEVMFKPTDWNVLKTEAIDFSKPFVWFDDTVLHAELEIMKKRIPKHVSYGLFLMDKRDSSAARDALTYLKSVEYTLL